MSSELFLFSVSYFCAQSEPSVFRSRSDRLSDKAVFESISEPSDHIRILVETKGTGPFSYSFVPERAEEVVCQVTRQAALALVSGLWGNEVLFGVATVDKHLLT